MQSYLETGTLERESFNGNYTNNDILVPFINLLKQTKYFSCFLLSIDFFHDQLFQKILSDIPSVSNSPNCLHLGKADDTSRQKS